MLKLKQKKKKQKGRRPDKWTLPEPDMHQWNTDAIRLHSEVELPDPFGGVVSRAGGTFAVSIPSDTYLKCETGLKPDALSTTKCTFKEK